MRTVICIPEGPVRCERGWMNGTAHWTRKLENIKLLLLFFFSSDIKKETEVRGGHMKRRCICLRIKK